MNELQARQIAEKLMDDDTLVWENHPTVPLYRVYRTFYQGNEVIVSDAAVTIESETIPVERGRFYQAFMDNIEEKIRANQIDSQQDVLDLFEVK